MHWYQASENVCRHVTQHSQRRCLDHARCAWGNAWHQQLQRLLPQDHILLLLLATHINGSLMFMTQPACIASAPVAQ
jgi:hypothetical protein